MKLKKYFREMIDTYSSIKLKHHFKNKIKLLLDRLDSTILSKNQKKEIQRYYSSFGFDNINTSWHKYYTHISKIFNKEYIPEDIYYTRIEPALNRKEMSPAFMDKNLLSKLFTSVKQPNTIAKNINGFYYSKKEELIQLNDVIEICKSYKQLVIKPSINSGGGKNVLLFENKQLSSTGKELSLIEVLRSYSQDFIIQEVVKQNKQMKLLNSSSINTIRILSYLNQSGVNILSAFIRIGKKGKFADNVSIDGIYCGVQHDGKLRDVGYDGFAKEIKKTDSGCSFQGFKIPHYSDVNNLVKNLHNQMPNFRLISWDLAIDEHNEIILIEYNVSWQDINYHQIANGPIFGKFTDEILKKI